MKNLTAEQAKRVNQAIKETALLLNKELYYSQDLQHKEKIQGYVNHIEKLNNMLANGWNAPKFN